MPPCAATYWSCLPTGSPRMSISISQAASASSRGGSVVRRASASAFSRQTVKAPEEPMPVPAGTSATEAISSGSPRQWRTSASRRIGCRISRGSSTSSNSEYFIR